MTVGVSVHKSGPLFDGRAEKAVTDACDDIEKQTATLGAAVIRQTMNVTFRHQTPYYRLKNVAEKHFPGWRIWDQGVIYGAWLEGVGSRNRTTRFKGYAIYRRSVQRIQSMAMNLGKEIIARYTGRMN